MTEKTKSVSLSFPISQVLIVVFLSMKLLHVIDWDWVWVLSPLWIPAALMMVSSVGLRMMVNK